MGGGGDEKNRGREKSADFAAKKSNFTVPYFFVRYTASYLHWYLDFVRYTATYRHRYLDFQMPVTQSARFRWSYGRIEDCEQSNFDFFAAKSADFSANLDFFSRQNPAKSADFSANFPLKIPRNFAFFFREISEALNWKVYQNSLSGKTLDFQKQYSTAKR